jgi:putative membrane protein
MNKFRNLSLVAILGVTTGALAQTPAPAVPENGATSNPSAAASPSQHDVLDKNAAESPEADSTPGLGAASTPHEPSVADTDANDHSAETKESSMTPAAFVGKAEQHGATEVALARIALEKSGDAKVRSFAQTMVRAHGDADAKLAALAQGKDITTSNRMDPEHEAMVDALKDKSGTSFDAAYAETVAEDHASAIALFEGMAKSGDGEFAAFAEQKLPTLREHKELADQLQDRMRTAAAEEKVHRE